MSPVPAGNGRHGENFVISSAGMTLVIVHVPVAENNSSDMLLECEATWLGMKGTRKPLSAAVRDAMLCGADLY
jgi:hypothetical protein